MADSCLILQVIPILRAGLVLVEHASSILPAIKTYHLGKVVLMHACVVDKVCSGLRFGLFITLEGLKECHDS